MGAQGLVAVGVPPQPLWLLYIKIAILVISLVVLALSAYSLSVFPIGAGGMDIFLAIFSWLVYGTAGALELWAPQYHYRIGALIGYILSVIFWLAAWAWSASEASVWLSAYRGTHGPITNAGGALAGCAALGAAAWVLTIVHLVFFIRACVMETTDPSQAELGQVKVEAGAVPQQQYQQPYPPQQQQPQAYPPQQPYVPEAQQPYVQQQQQPYPQQPQQPYPQQ